MLKISAAYPQFKFLNLSKFACGEHSFETGIFDFEGSEFIFIPGDEPELGWDDFAVLDENSAKEIKEQCDFCPEDQSLREFVAKQTSPLRRVKIPAMLAERKPAELSWYEVDLSDERLKIYAKEIEDFSRGKDKDISEMTVCGALKLVREDGKIRAFLFDDVTHEEFEANLRKNGFSLPSQDEWEYLAGCGARTLWRFGDEPDLDKVRYRTLSSPKIRNFRYLSPIYSGYSSPLILTLSSLLARRYTLKAAARRCLSAYCPSRLFTLRAWSFWTAAVSTIQLAGTFFWIRLSYKFPLIRCL